MPTRLVESGAVDVHRPRAVVPKVEAAVAFELELRLLPRHLASTALQRHIHIRLFQTRCTASAPEARAGARAACSEHLFWFRHKVLISNLFSHNPSAPECMLQCTTWEQSQWFDDALR